MGWTPIAANQVPLYLGATAGLRELHDRDRDEAGAQPEAFGNPPKSHGV